MDLANLILLSLSFSFLCEKTIFLPVVGLVDAEKLKPGDLVGVNKDSYLVLETLPAESGPFFLFVFDSFFFSNIFSKKTKQQV